MKRKDMLFLLSVIDRKIVSFYDDPLYKTDSVSYIDYQVAKNIIINELHNDTTVHKEPKPGDIQE